MKEFELKYGCNPNQSPSRIYMKNGELPIDIINCRPGYINLLDALNSWQLVKELKEATGLPSATSFKHVSPAGAGVAYPLDDSAKKMYFAEDLELSDIASAYLRARGADRVASYGDWVALSDECDEVTALYLSKEVSDGIIAPSYSPKALEILKSKRKGTYNVVRIDKDYIPEIIETKEVFGITFEQRRNDFLISEDLLKNIPTANKTMSAKDINNLLISLITLKYTQSNSVCYVKDGQAIGIGAGQQARIHCTRLAGNKADLWYLRSHPKVLDLKYEATAHRYDRDNLIDTLLLDESLLTNAEKLDWLKTMTNVALGSDAYFPFGDNIERAMKSGVKFIAQPGGSIRDDNVIETCDKYGIVMALTGMRLFHH